MSKLQEVFQRIEKDKKQIKEIKKIYKESLDSSEKYKSILEEFQKIKEQKKIIEQGIKDDFKSEFSKLEELKDSINDDKMLLSDLAINKITKGESIKINDDNNEYEPIFSVKFKKIN